MGGGHQGHQAHSHGLVVSRQFLATLAVGVTFGFSFAYMLLGAAGAGRRELFQGPPYPRDLAGPPSDPHSHQASLEVCTVLVGSGQVARCVPTSVPARQPREDNRHKHSWIFIKLEHS